MGLPIRDRTRHAKAKLEDIEPREVSPVDRPANGHPFLIVKSEGGATSEDSMGKAATQKNTGAGAPPPAQEEQMAQGTPPAPPPPIGEGGEAPGAAPDTEEQGPESTDEVSAALVLPPGAKAPLVGALKSAHGRLGQIVMMLEKATEAEGAEMPGEPVVMIADAAGAIAMAVEPYLMKQAGLGMATGETEVGKSAEWTREYIDSLEDWCFLLVEPSTERDSAWRTLPLSNRKFPVRDHAGRLCVSMVVQAAAAIAGGSEPFLSGQKKRQLMLRLASMRLCEAADAAYREEPMLPETAAELSAVAEMVVGVAQMGAPAPAPAAGVPAGEAAPATSQGEQMMALAEKCAATIKSLVAAKSAPAPVEKSDPYTALKGEVAQVKTVIQRMEELMSAGGEVAQSAPPPAATEQEKATDVAKSDAAPATSTVPADLEQRIQDAVTKALSAKDAEVASLRAEVTKTQGELGKAKAEVTKAQTDLAAKKVELAKAQRAVPPSNVDREESTAVAKADRKSPLGYVTDLNEIFKQEEQQSQTAA